VREKERGRVRERERKYGSRERHFRLRSRCVISIPRCAFPDLDIRYPISIRVSRSGYPFSLGHVAGRTSDIWSNQLTS